MTIRAAFAAEFGEDQAAAFEVAAEMHQNGVHDERGSDPFKWALAIAIGYECFLKDGYREFHGITADADAVKAWIKEHADLGSHDGDVDFLGLVAGSYDDYLSVN